MRLIGMLDSPYVRRVAVSLQLMGLPFTHESVSVFRTFDQFRAINPVVKAPTLVCDDGTVLMDSSLILDYAEHLPACRRALMPAGLPERQQALRAIGLALAACEKAVQIIYEHELRPADKRHAPWLDRVTGQMIAGLQALEAELARRPPVVSTEALDQAGVCAAVVWHFIAQMLPAQAAALELPALRRLSSQAEALPAFRAAPHGDSVYPVQ